MKFVNYKHLIITLKKTQKTQHRVPKWGGSYDSSDMLERNEQKPKANSEILSLKEHQGPVFELNEGQNISAECSQRKHSLPLSLTTSTNEDILKIPLEDGPPPTSNSGNNKSNIDITKYGECDNSFASLQLQKFCTGKQDHKSLAEYLKKEEEEDMSKDLQAVNLDAERNQDRNSLRADYPGTSRSFQTSGEENLQNICDQFRKQDQDSHAELRLLCKGLDSNLGSKMIEAGVKEPTTSSISTSKVEQQLGPVAEDELQCDATEEGIFPIDENAGKWQHTDHNGKKSMPIIAVPLCTSASPTSYQLESLQFEYGDSQPHSMDKTSATVPYGFTSVEVEKCRDAGALIEHLDDDSVNASLEESQQSTFAVKSGNTTEYSEEPVLVMKGRSPIPCISNPSVASQEEMPTNNISPVQKETPSQSVEDFPSSNIQFMVNVRQSDGDDVPRMVNRPRPTESENRLNGGSAKQKERTRRHSIPQVQPEHSFSRDTQRINAPRQTDVTISSASTLDSTNLESDIPPAPRASSRPCKSQSLHLPLYRNNLCLSSNKTGGQNSRARVDEPKPTASPGVDKDHQNNLGVHVSTNTKKELRSPLNDQFHKVVDVPTGMFHFEAVNTQPDYDQEQREFNTAISSLIPPTSAQSSTSHESPDDLVFAGHEHCDDFSPLPLGEVVVNEQLFSRSLTVTEQDDPNDLVSCNAGMSLIPCKSASNSENQVDSGERSIMSGSLAESNHNEMLGSLPNTMIDVSHEGSCKLDHIPSSPAPAGPLRQSARNIDDPGVAKSGYSEGMPQSLPNDFGVTANSQHFSGGITQDECIDQGNSVLDYESQLHSGEITTSILPGSLETSTSNNHKMPAASLHSVTPDASDEGLYKPDHRSRRKSTIPNSIHSSVRYAASERLRSAFDVMESVEDQRSWNVSQSSENSLSQVAELAVCTSDTNAVQVNESEDLNYVEDGYTDETVQMPVSVREPNEIELTNRIIPKCCSQCKDSVTQLIEQNQRQICEDCLRSNQREANHNPRHGHYRRYGKCFSCKLAMTKRRWKQCLQCGKIFCRRDCLATHSCINKAF